MGLAPTDGRLIRPITEPTIARVEFDWHESVAQALYLHPELRRTKTRIKQNELELISAKNQILPEVNLSLLYRWVGVGDELGLGGSSRTGFPNADSSALAELTGGDYQEAAIRLDIQPTAIGARRELARIRNAQFRLARERAFLQDQERLHLSQLSDAASKVTTHYQLVQDNANRWQQSEQEVQARLAEYRGGRIAVNVVLQSQLRRAQAQIDYYRALAEYNKSINYVHYLKGTLLQHNNIDLAEGPWHSKAYWDALERARERSAGRQWKYGVSRPGVVRQGPLADSQTVAAGEVPAGPGATLPPGELHSWQESAGDQPLGLQDAMGMPIDRQPVPVNDTPLSRLGSPAQILQGAAAAPAAGQPSAAAVRTAGSQTPAAPATRGAGVRQAVGSGVIGDRPEVHSGDGYAPAPVRKKPAWVPQG